MAAKFLALDYLKLIDKSKEFKEGEVGTSDSTVLRSRIQFALLERISRGKSFRGAKWFSGQVKTLKNNLLVNSWRKIKEVLRKIVEYWKTDNGKFQNIVRECDRIQKV